MSTEGLNQGAAGVGPAELQIDHLRVSKTRTRLTARLDGELIHQDEINVSGAAARGRVAERTGLEPAGVEEQRLGIAAELAELDGDDE